MCREDLNSAGEAMFTTVLANSCSASWDGCRGIANVLRVHKQVNPSIIAWDITYDRICALSVL